MATFADWRRALARWIAPPANGRVAVGSAFGGFGLMRSYDSARQSRLTAGWTTSNGSADAELNQDLTKLRTRSRALVRNAAYAKRARIVVVNNVVGSGIGMQAQVMTSRDVPNDRVNGEIESVWERWCGAKSCHTGGSMHFADMERAGMGQVFDAGEVLFRKHYSAFGDSRVPYALELIEAERIADEYPSQFGAMTPQPGNLLRMGIEVDGLFHRPVAYWIHTRHLTDVYTGEQARDAIERVPAEQIIHLRLVDRWPQTRGEPWLHAVARKLNDMDGYSEAEIVAARGAASYMGFIQTPEGSNSAEGEDMGDGTQQVELTPGIFEKLAPGESMNMFSPNRPNTALDPFMRYMLREVAAGVGVSYESLSRDYSQSNYSSSRLALLDDRDLWRMLQLWFIRSFREECHREWLRQAVMARAITAIPLEQYAADVPKFEAVKFKPRGWSWIDPQKEVEARKMAVRAGFDTITNVIAETANGRDLEDVMRERRRELDMAEKLDLDYDTDVVDEITLQEAKSPAPAPAPAASTPEEDRAVIRALDSALIKAELRGEEAGRKEVTAEAIASVARAIAEHHPAPVIVEKTPGKTIRRVTDWTDDGLPKTVEITEAQPFKRIRTVTEWDDEGLPKTVEESDA